jgi:phosphoglycerol transferase MdoB-like AlkP superfamily enzyme
MKKLDFFPQHFKQKGYHFSFYYGGDVNFYNTRMLLIQSGVDEIVSSADYPNQISNLQKWGVPDQYLYQRMFDDLQKMKQPFLSMVYNISSHEPFDIPAFKRIKGNRSLDKYCNSISYADSCLGDFIDKLKSSPLWDNTLVIVTSDHTSRDPGATTFDDPASYRIPLLWIGGVIDTTFVNTNIAMQTDLSSTLIQQMGWKPNPNFFSKSIFGSKQYAFFFRDEGWGFLSPETGFFMNLESRKQQFYYGEQSTERDSLTNFSKSYTQYLHDDFRRK